MTQMDPRPNLPSARVPEQLLASRVQIEVRDPAAIFSALPRSDVGRVGSMTAARIVGEAFEYSSLTYMSDPNLLRDGERLELKFGLQSQFVRHTREGMCEELNLRLYNSCGPEYGASLGVDERGDPSLHVSRRTEIDGFKMDENIATFSYVPAGWVRFKYAPEMTDVRIASHVETEGTVALKILKDFIDSHYRLSNKVPPKERLILRTGE